MSLLSETRRQNKEERIKRDGPFAEKLRQRSLRTLQAHMAAFYEHGRLPDIDFLIGAFELMERETRDNGEAATAPLVDTIARLLAARPSISRRQREPAKAKSPKRPSRPQLIGRTLQR